MRMDRGETVGLDRSPGDLSQVLTAEQVLDSITLYWLTGTGASSARLYWESIAQVTDWFTTATSDVVTVPTGCSIFPREVPLAFPPLGRAALRQYRALERTGPRRSLRRVEQPGLFINEVRAVARSLPC